MGKKSFQTDVQGDKLLGNGLKWLVIIQVTLRLGGVADKRQANFTFRIRCKK